MFFRREAASGYGEVLPAAAFKHVPYALSILASKNALMSDV